MTRDEAVTAVNIAREARDTAFAQDPGSEDTAKAYMVLESAYRRLAHVTTDEVSRVAMHEAADAMALLAFHMDALGGAS